ncbi:hypothetical protein ACQ4PT_021873 [Festuca glaucescens]
MAFPAASGAAPPAPLPVVGHQFCAPYVVPLTVTKKALSISDGDFAITDANGALVLKVKGSIFTMRHRRVLLDAAGQPLLSMQEKSKRGVPAFLFGYGKIERGEYIFLFFLRGRGRIHKSFELTEKPRKQEKLQRSPSELRSRRRPEREGGAPLPLLVNLPWFDEASPMAAGKSAFTAPRGVTPWTIGSTAKLHAVVFDSFNIAGIRRLTGSARGCSKCTTNPKICEHGEGGLDAEALRRTPPPEGTSCSTKIQIGGDTTSSSPSPGDQLATTLCTHRSSGIPHPPAAGAAGGGGGIPRTPGGEVELAVVFRKSPSPHCRRERGSPRQLLSIYFFIYKL